LKGCDAHVARMAGEAPQFEAKQANPAKQEITKCLA
jgi:hypothetical protein